MTLHFPQKSPDSQHTLRGYGISSFNKTTITAYVNKGRTRTRTRHCKAAALQQTDGTNFVIFFVPVLYFAYFQVLGKLKRSVMSNICVAAMFFSVALSAKTQTKTCPVFFCLKRSFCCLKVAKFTY